MTGHGMCRDRYAAKPQVIAVNKFSTAQPKAKGKVGAKKAKERNADPDDEVDSPRGVDQIAAACG